MGLVDRVRAQLEALRPEPAGAATIFPGAGASAAVVRPNPVSPAAGAGDPTPNETAEPDTAVAPVVASAPVVAGVPDPAPEFDRVVPRGLQIAASWSWRVILVAGLIYGVYRLTGVLSEVVIPLGVAILLTAMLSPVANRLRSWGLPGGAATAITVLGGLALIAGALTLIVTQIAAQSADLTTNVIEGFKALTAYAQNGPFAQYVNVGTLTEQAQRLLTDSQGALATYAAEIGASVGHFLAGFFITLFSLFYFLYDGRGIFTFLLKFFPRDARARVDEAAHKGWISLSHYVRATILVALTDAVGVLIWALVLGVPVAPALAALVFIGAFVPLVGAFVSGFLAVIVALVALGWFKALLMLLGIIVVMQIEGHLLQPFLLGRAVKLHPLAVLLAIAIGIILGGIVGALMAVPILAFTKSFVQYLHGAVDPPLVRAIRWPIAARRV